jgi:hypothetical protein
MTIRSLVVMAGTALAVNAAAEALGCSCRPPRSVQTELQESVAVLEGDVLSVSPADSGGMVGVRLRVVRAWKGVSSPEMVVRTNSLMCGLAFRTGERWLVFAHSQPLGAGMCGKSGHMTLSQRSPFGREMIKRLGKPTWVSPP